MFAQINISLFSIYKITVYCEPMQEETCKQCKASVEAWNERCRECGYHLILEPNERRKARYLRRPSIGALFWTQGWTVGARLYLWFVLSLMPVIGIVALVACTLFGRRWSWKYGGWQDWDTFTERMRLMDILATVWIVGLIGVYFWARQTGGI